MGLAEPRLPEELERIIFEIAAREDRSRMLPTLLQVARRVREWLQAIIYKTVILEDSEFYETSKSPIYRPPRFPSGAQTLYIKNLLVSGLDNGVKSEPHWNKLPPQ
ncbi:hypothetical protein AX16_006034 [Volvariella volvacea WC 439]|nr:hypothetical protein AX16_006034 [Volvariella volvacea WC 439]